MQNAETGSDAARQEAKRECTDLIFRLWEHRAVMLPGRPLGEIIEAFEALTENSRSAPRRSKSSSHTWQNTLGELREIHSQELDIWRKAAFSSIAPKAAQKWLRQQAIPLSSEEKRLAAIFQSSIDHELAIDLPHLRDRSPAEHHAAALARIQALQQRRTDLIARLSAPGKQTAVGA